MAANLFVIEAPGKRRGLFNVLRRARVRDIQIEATVGHLCGNPEGFHVLGVDADFRETLYRIKPDRERLVATIACRAAEAKRIYLATDDDQEGDVIARDVLRFCIPKEHRFKTLRLRLKALAQAEVVAALRAAKPFEELMAAQGDARRIIDRLIGSLSSDAGAVGRVQGSLLLALGERQPVAGVITHTLAAIDGRGDFVAKAPVFAGRPVPEPLRLNNQVRVASASKVTMAAAPMNYSQVVLAASLRTGLGISEVSAAMQSAYECGRLSYPRAKDCAICPESLRRLSMVARANGAAFRSELFSHIREASGEHAHESPNPLVLDVPVNRTFDLLSREDQVLVTITQHLIDHGIEGRLERPVEAQLPASAAGLNWSRLTAVGTRLWATEPTEAGFQPWTPEQSLLHFMMKNELGRPSTVISHIEKMLARGLITPAVQLTEKGRQWSVNAARVLGHRNVSALIENYIETTRKSPPEMVSEMVELLELKVVKAQVDQAQRHTHEEHEVSAGYVS